MRGRNITTSRNSNSGSGGIVSCGHSDVFGNGSAVMVEFKFRVPQIYVLLAKNSVTWMAREFLGN
jgi:hypothetical protein